METSRTELFQIFLDPRRRAEESIDVCANVAADLDVTIDRVHRHIKAIRARIGTSRMVEIYAEFIAQRVMV